MRKKTRWLFAVIVLVTAAAMFSQGKLTGVVNDKSGALPGASVVIKGTTVGTTTDFDGKFTLNTQKNRGTLEISFIGYATKLVSFNVANGTTKDLGVINLKVDSETLDEIVVTSVSFAIDRKTPVAVSTIKSIDIETKLGTQEFPEILKSTPGVYATKAGGGFGDGRINLRGFNSENVAVLINGVPVNDMENGRVFWSNWAGLSDVTSAMQVQRGLGASKVAVPSVGGTINILSKTTDVEAGGNIYTTLANDGYEKFGFTYSTGLSENGFAATISVSKTDGDGFVDGTQFEAVSYFVNISQQINDNHKLSLTAFGAKQRHGQRQNRHTIETFRNSERGIRFNSDWGYKQGQVTHIEDNFYHKPQISLNHYWTISDKTYVSTAAYISYGTGGGGGTAGSQRSKFTSDDYKIGTLGPVDLDRIVDENIANGANGSSAILRASRNDHVWYGLLSTLKTDLSDKLILLTGIDLRHYRGSHFQEVTDLLGGQYFADDSNVNNPLNAAQVGDKINFYNDGIVNWLGFFGQLEYNKDKLSSFVSLSASNTSYKREDFFQKLDSDPTQETDSFNFFGFGAKGGANYNIDDKHNVFANLGYFEKAPDFRSVFPTFDNDVVNDGAVNEKITSFELGYGYRAEEFTANVNVYYTKWEDRTEIARFQQPDNTTAFANILGVNALHQGIEIDFVYRVSDKLKFTGMGSFGDWTWQDNVENVEIRDENQNLIRTVDIFIKDLHVGDAAQTTMALGANFSLTDKTTLIVDYNFYDNLYADFNPSDRGVVGPDALQLPDYSLFDVSFRHGFRFGTFDAILSGRINNVLDAKYVADAFDGSITSALVYFGAGRSFSVGLKLKF